MATQRPTQMRNGRFTIIRPLSQGGMGALYLASEPIATGTRKVVIKEMLDYYDPGDPQGLQKAQRRFEAEAITLANLSIPGIPQVFDYFSDGGRNYIVMQFIEGQNLESGLSRFDERGYPIKGKAYPAEQVRRWGVLLSRLLESLAMQNVIHMDIKPANLILDKSGTVWLVDFGTAKASRLTVSGAPAGGPTGLKKSSVYGTLGYAAPEQAAGKPEPRSDVYALAATLYHLATDDDPGEHPGKFPEIGRLPADFTAALKNALSLDVRKRANAREFGQALEPRVTRPLGFHWQDGTISQDPQELALASDDRWEEARSYFSGQGWENWFDDMHRHDLSARLAQFKNQITDPDMGLDAFLRALNPNLPAAQLHVPVTVVDAGLLPWRSQKIIDLEIQNKGAGALQVRLVNAPTGIATSPDVMAVHRRQALKLVINSNSFSPSQKPQLLPITLDAGVAGRVRVRLRLTIPAPVIEVIPPQLDLEPVHRGKALNAALVVRNAGNSPFHCEIASRFHTFGIHPTQMDCLPGEEHRINIVIDTQRLGLGAHFGEVAVQAQAGAWQQVQSVPVNFTVSLWKTFWKFGSPILLWAATGGFFGGFLGWFLATLVGGVDGQVVSPVLGGLAGMLLGMVLCVFPATAVGGFGWLGAPMGKLGLRQGAFLGGVSGALTGGLTGALVGWLGAGVEAFGIIVGGISGAVLGVLFQQRMKK